MYIHAIYIKINGFTFWNTEKLKETNVFNSRGCYSLLLSNSIW